MLSSYYEGFGLVLAEANILGLPIISTDIPGPRQFMNDYGGVLVENSTSGLIEGMRKMIDCKVKVLDIDYKKYNEDAYEMFKSLLN